MNKPLELKHAGTHNGIHLWRVETGQFPLPEAERLRVADLLLSWMHAFAGSQHLNETVWLEATHIHEEGATKLISPNASAWVPRTGFGVHPKGPLPRLWTNDDFGGAAFGHKVPVFNNQVFEISRSTGHASAIRTMAGRGVLMIVLLQGTVEAFKQQMTTTLGSMVKEESFHAYPFFFPLLQAEDADDAALGIWMGNAAIYIRESAEDKAILVFSRLPLEDSLRTIGAVQHGDAWRFQAEEAQ